MVSSIGATTIMTVFSYGISWLTSKNMNEPEQLSTFVQSTVKCENVTAKISGWFLHYLIGAAFVAVYSFIWVNKIIEPSFVNSLFIGFLSGLIGAAAWYIMLKLKPFGPVYYWPLYYRNLIVAHVVFAISASYIFKHL